MSVRVPDLIELAWAAGFYDGEGSTGSYQQKQSSTFGLRVSVTQADQRALIRFQAALRGLGRIGGPERKYSEAHNTTWTWKANGVEALSALNLLWPYLGEVKCEQARAAIEKWGSVAPLTIPNAWKTHCDSGHRLSGSNLIVRVGKGRRRRRCRLCDNEIYKRYRARKKALASA